MKLSKRLLIGEPKEDTSMIFAVKMVFPSSSLSYTGNRLYFYKIENEWSYDKATGDIVYNTVGRVEHQYVDLGSFYYTTTYWTAAYSYDPRPPYGYRRDAVYYGTKFNPNSTPNYWMDELNRSNAGFTKDEFIANIQNYINTGTPWRTAHNINAGDLNRYDNFWLNITFKQAFVTYLQNMIVA